MSRQANPGKSSLPTHSKRFPDVIAIRHSSFQHLGTLAAVLPERKLSLTYLEPGMTEIGSFDPLAPKLLVVLDGPLNATDEANYPFLTEELRMIEARLAAKRPVLGIGLGAQLMARALGARVYPSTSPEFSWNQIILTKCGKLSPLGELVDCRHTVFHQYRRRADLPAGAECLAFTTDVENQAFRMDTYGLAIQFHLEINASEIDRWLIGHAPELRSSGLTPNNIRKDSAIFGPHLAECARTVFARWLDEAGL